MQPEGENPAQDVAHCQQPTTGMRPALIVFGKPPSSGQVKTRLSPRLSPRDAAALYRAFLEDALRQYSSLPVDVRLYMAGETSGSLDIPRGTTVLNQKGDGLGERMLDAFSETFEAGYERVAIVGTDHPTLPTAFITRAFEELRAPNTVVIGPAEDGGYYLLGLNKLQPALFQGMDYSHPGVFDDTVQRVKESPATLAALPSWYDVDRPEELPRLLSDLDSDREQAPRTHALLQTLVEKYEWIES